MNGRSGAVKEAAGFFAEVRERLGRLIEARPYRFTETRRSVAQRYLRTALHFSGYAEGEIQEVERLANGPLPAMYREFLAQMGIACGDLFCDCRLPVPGQARAFLATAKRILARSAGHLELPARSVVVYIREGCIFTTIQAQGGEDAVVRLFSEDEGSFVEAAGSFRALVSERLEALEERHRISTEAGGYFVTINERFGIRHRYPARNSGVRALDSADEFIE